MNSPAPQTSKPSKKLGLEHYQVCFTMNDGCAAPQGHFRSREEAKKWAGKRPCWIVWTPPDDPKNIKWTVREKKACLSG